MPGLNERGFDDLAGEDVVDLGELVGTVEAEIVHEMPGGPVDEGFPGDGLVAAGDDDEFLLEELLDAVVRADAADGLDLGLGDGLFVGDDGEGLEGGRRKALEELVAVELGDGLVEGPLGEELPAAAALPQFEGVELGGVLLADAFDAGLDLFEDDAVVQDGEGVVDQVHDVERRQGLLAGEDERLDVGDQV